MTTHSEILEALPVAVYMTDAEGRIPFYNQAAADLGAVGRSLESTAGWR
jgi:PAS domain-containing protein